MLRDVKDVSAGIARELHAAFVEAYEPYVVRRLAESELPTPPGLDAALEAGRRWLDGALDELLAVAPGRQRRSPLELFQEALRFPTEALQADGVPAPPRDRVASNALPGDVYGLAPASSQVLGERAWRAHVAWGMQKAELVAGMVPASSPKSAPTEPTVALVGSNLMDRARIEESAAGAGYRLEPWRNPAAVAAGLQTGSPALVLVDLDHPAADEAIRAAAAAGCRVVAFGPHVDDIAMARAAALGATEVLARSRFFRRLPGLLPRIV
jgi:hypothetical protein